ncbi:MAG: acyltransferase domain-containing protein [Cyanobacteria bacterium P01_G01_bin.49]
MMLSASLPRSKTSTVWVFPGQGSQKLGMGMDLLQSPFAKLRLQQAEAILGWSISEVWQGQDKKLSNTRYTQPCLYLFMTLLVDLMKRSGYLPDIVAGYSFGEYVALYAAGAYDFETGLKLIQKRSEIMSRLPKGSMVTLKGFEPAQLKRAIKKTPNVWLANDDFTYAIISGTSEGIDAILSTVDIERVIPLEVSAAFHTPLVKPAAEEFQEILESTVFQPFDIPVFSSIDFVPRVNIEKLKNSLICQISEPVRWQTISGALVTQRIEQAIQIGCGQGLLKPMKKVDPSLEISNVGSTADINSLVIRDQLRKMSTLKSKALKV